MLTSPEATQGREIPQQRLRPKTGRKLRSGFEDETVTVSGARTLRCERSCETTRAASGPTPRRVAEANEVWKVRPTK